MAKRTDLLLSEKIALLKNFRSQPRGTSQRKLCELFGVPKSTVSKLLNEETLLTERWTLEQAGLGKRKRDGKDPEVEEALNLWFSTIITKGVRISGPILKNKAKELAQMLGRSDFVATDGWFARWKTRHMIKYKRANGEKGSADTVGAEEWMSIVFPQLLREYKPDDIYNADETGLYYRATPDGSLCYAYQQLSGSKKAMDRITIMCCANMTSKDKVKLIVIGKSKKPRCFKGIDVDTLPVSYHANKNAWMTSLLFEDWITRWDSALGKQSRKILLLVDNCTAHPALDTLKSIHLEFLPPNTTSLIQPMDQGIIKNLKVHYRKELVQMTITAIEDNLLSTSCMATEVSAKITILDAIRVVAKSWRQVKTQTIANCFRKGGFLVTASEDGTESRNLASQESDEEQALPQVVNGDSCLRIDEDMKCYNEDDTLEDDIVETLSNKRLCLEDGSDSDSDNDTVVKISHVAAKRSIQVLQQYFVEQGFSDTLHASLDASKMAQTTLDSFVA